MERRLVVATDLDDNMHRRAAVDLTGTQVLIHVVGSADDPWKVQQARKEWAKELKEAGAESVQFPVEPPAPYVSTGDSET